MCTFQEQPPTLTIQPNSVFSVRHPYPTSALRPSRDFGAIYLQRLRFHTLPSAQAGQQPMEANLRLTTIEQGMRSKATQDENATGGRHLTSKGDTMFSLDPQDGFYALNINPTDRDYFTVDVR
jgi:hypothetical protein